MIPIKFKQQNELCKFLPALVLTNAGLFIVDHVHFQYNGFLLGIFMMSIGCMMSDCYLSSALLFAILLNFKHIYVYCAPAYFVYLLSTYCRVCYFAIFSNPKCILKFFQVFSLVQFQNVQFYKNLSAI